MLARIIVVVAFLFTTTLYADDHENALTGLQEATEVLIAEVTSNRNDIRNDRHRWYRIVNNTIVKNFDFKRMSGLALGKISRRATDAEKVQFEEEFTALIVRTYSTAILSYTNQNIAWKTSAMDSKGRITVTATITNENDAHVEIKFKMAKSKRYAGWRAYDVVIEGVSIILGYRSIFSEQEKSIGISGIITEIRNKNEAAYK